MEEKLESLLKKANDGDLDAEIWRVQVLGLPGLTWVNRSEFKKAEKKLKKALAQAEKKGGLNHPATALINYFLGDAFMRHGRPASAEAHLLRVMEIWARSDVDNYKGIIHKLLDLAADYGEAGDVSSSERLGRTIADAVKKHLTAGDSLIVSALTDLAVTFQIQGRPSEAEDLFREALLQSEQNSETLSRFGPRILMNLAAVSTSRHEFLQAEIRLNRALDIANAAEHRDEGHVLEILCNKAKVYAALGKSAGLEEAVAQVEVVYEAAWRSEPETVVPLILDLVRLLGAFGLNDAADKIYKRLTEDTAAAPNEGNKERCLAIIDAWLKDFKLRGGDPRIGEIMRENRRKIEEYFR